MARPKKAEQYVIDAYESGDIKTTPYDEPVTEENYTRINRLLVLYNQDSESLHDAAQRIAEASPGVLAMTDREMRAIKNGDLHIIVLKD